MYSINVAKDSVKVVRVEDMNIGDIGIVQDAESWFNNHIVLRIYSGLISLTDPKNTWTNLPEYPPEFDIRLFPKGTKIELEVQ